MGEITLVKPVKSPVKMADNLDSIEKRLADLGKQIFGDASKDAAYPKDRPAEEAIVDTLGRLNTQVNNAVASRPKIQTVMKRLDQLERVLDPTQMDNLMLSQEVKADIVLAEED